MLMYSITIKNVIQAIAVFFLPPVLALESRVPKCAPRREVLF